jgi:DNA-binding phage protein
MQHSEPDPALIARQLLRALRGRRSQLAFSRRLGFASNVAAEWESGRRVPSAVTALRAAQRVGIDVQAQLRAFRPSTSANLGRLDAANLAAWLRAQQGNQALGAIAQRAALSRHQVSRFLAGHATPRLHHFLSLVQACSGRVSDLVALLVDINAVRSLREEHARLSALRRLALEAPWTSAIIAALECVSRLEIELARTALMRMLGLPEDELTRYLQQMEQAGVLQRRQNRFVLGDPLVIDIGAASESRSRLTRHWAEVGATRAGSPRHNDVFSYNVFSVSRADLARIAALQREFFQRVRALIGSSPAETLAVMNLQLFEFDPESLFIST